MSRSFRKTPISSFANADSEKYDKQLCNRKLRRKAKRRIRESVDNPDIIFPTPNEVYDMSYIGAKDGKGFIDVERHPEIMRK